MCPGRVGIEPDVVCGTSIGALVGGAYVGGWIDPLEAWAREPTRVGLARLLDIQLGHDGLIHARVAAPQMRTFSVAE